MDNKAIVRQVFEAFTTGNLDLLDPIMAPMLIDDNPGEEQGPGLDGIKQHLRAYRRAFPDLAFEVQDEIGEGDRVAVRYLVRGTQQGDFFGHPATNIKIAANGLDLYRIQDGKIIQQWGGINQLELRQQLGILPR